MSEYVKLATGAGDQFLATLAESQETFLKSMSAATSSWTPVQAPVAVPAFAAELPTPKEVVEANFAFASKLLKQQKEFVDKFFAATSAK